MVPGRFGWTGGFGISAYADPKNTVRRHPDDAAKMMDSPATSPAVFNDFWRFVYLALGAAHLLKASQA